MTPSEMVRVPGRLTARLGNFLGRLGRACFRHPFIVLGVWTLAAVFSTWAMSRLTVDPDISELLPEHYESVQDIKKVRKRVGGVGYVVVLLEGGSIEQRHRLTDALGKELENSNSVSYVETRRPEAYLREKALWLMDLSDLEKLESRVHDRYAYGINRFFLDLDDAEPPPVETKDLLENFTRRFGKSAAIAGPSSTTPQTDFYERENQQALFVRPTRLATDLEFSKRVVRDVESAVARVQKDVGAGEVTVRLAGRYKKRVDLQQVVSRDLRLATVLALLLVAGYVWWHFRSPTAILLLLLPLVLGLSLSYGLAAISFGVLNILTAFLGAILVGLGIDTGIHLLGRVQEETARGKALSAAVQTAFSDAGRVAVGASLTTAAAFGCLAITEFRAFREFGLLTGAGILFVLLSYLTLTPALLRLASRLTLTRPPATSARLPGMGFLLRHRALALVVLGVPLLALLPRASTVQFDSDLSRMDRADLPSFRLDDSINDLLGRSQTPLVAFAEDKEQALLATRTLRADMERHGDRATIGRIVTLAELVPEDIEAKKPLVQSLRRMISRLPEDDPWRAEMKARIDLDRALGSSAPSVGDMPPSLRDVVAPSRNDGHGPLVLLYPTVSLGDAVAMERLSDQVRHIELPTGDVVRTAGEPMIVVDILDLLRQDGPIILAATLFLVVLLLWLTLGSLRLALFSLLPAILILFVTAGTLAALDMKFTVLSIIILPILLGIGVDDGAHLLSRLATGVGVNSVWTHTGAAVSAALLTDTFGFGVLALAAHPGLRGLGIVSLIGLGANFVICVLVLPLLVSLRPRLFGAPRTPPSFTPALSRN